MPDETTLKINGKAYSLTVGKDVPLLWAIREHLGLAGTKFGCGIAQCGACTVHVDGRAVRSCQWTVGRAEGREVTTIEGIPEDHPVKRAWIAEQVPQCGYCQSGQIMQAVALLAEHANPSEDEIVRAMQGNLCRCGTYMRIKRAIRRASGEEARS